MKYTYTKSELDSIKQEIKDLKQQIQMLQYFIDEREFILNTLNVETIIKNQIKASQIILQNVREQIDPYAIIAGGAPRNWYIGVPANDIDIYLYHPNNGYYNDQLIHRCIDILDIENLYYNRLLDRNETVEIDMYSGNLSVLNTVLEYTYEMDHLFKDSKYPIDLMVLPVQLIFTKTDEDRWRILESFQVSLSEIYFDGSNIYGSDSFLYSLHNKIIEMSKDRYNKYGSNSNYYKKLEKYFSPEFEIKLTDYKYKGLCNHIMTTNKEGQRFNKKVIGLDHLT